MRHERGIALITVMLIVALVATTAAYVSMAQAIWIRQAQNLNELSMAETVTQGGLAFALYALDQDTDLNNDNLTEPWAQGIAAPFANGAVAGRLVDAQGKFNLNNLALGSQTDIGIFRRLMAGQGIVDQQLIDNLTAWITPGTNAASSGVRSDYYLSQPGHYRAANQLLQSVDELRLIKGFGGVDNDIVQKLRPFVTALPISNVKININTAPPAVIAALFNPPLTIEEAQRVLAQRDIEGGRKGAPFRSVADLQKLVTNTQIVQGCCDVKSSFFEAEALAKFGHLQYPTLALIQRGASAAGGAKQGSHILWQRYNVVKELPLAKK